jgi:hypothetical protein
VDAVIDDRLLIEELLVGLDQRGTRLHTTTYWYYRACRVSGPFQGLSVDEQQRAIASMLQLPETIGLPDPRHIVALMVAVAGRHPRLNLLNLEAAATAHILQATIWLSPESASGVLPAVLESEGLDWMTVTPT